MAGYIKEIYEAIEERDVPNFEKLVGLAFSSLNDGKKRDILDLVMRKDDFEMLQILADKDYYFEVLFKCIVRNNFLYFEQLFNMRSHEVKGSKRDLFRQINYYKLAFGYAAKSKDERCLALLLNHFDIQAKMNIMLHCIYEGNSMWIRKPSGERIDQNINVLRAFLENGFDPNRTSDDHCKGDTLLHKATRCQDIEVMNLLMQYNADTNVEDDKKETPLFMAVRESLESSCKVLLENGAQVNIRNGLLSTPMHVLGLAYKHDILKMLLNAGGCLNAMDSRGATLLCDAVPRFFDIPIHTTNVIFLIQNGSDVKHIHKDEKEKKCFYSCLKLHHSILITTLMAGLKLEDVLWCDDEKERENISNIPEIRKEIENQLKLKYLCRLTIRNHLIEVGEGRSIYPRVERLLIPSEMKSYLKLEF